VKPGIGAELVAQLPPDAAPNGITLAPDGLLYVADTFAGRIWKVDPRRRTAAIWIDSPVLKARPFVGTYPGVNGVQTDGHAVFATISDTALLVRVPILQNGRAGRPTIVSNEIAGDDFAIDADGSLLVTTHPFNTVERVDPSGRRTLLAGPEQGVVGPVTAALGRERSGPRVLYVATDGGLYAPIAGQVPVAKLLRSFWMIYPRNEPPSDVKARARAEPRRF
jgi:sugar lactone lactonase YvrE